MRLDELDSTALEHHGLVTRATSGLSRSAWYRALAAGTLEQLHPGVARLIGTPRTYRQRIAAGVAAASSRPTGPTQAPRTAVVLASHRSAASLHLDDVDPPDDPPVDIIIPTRQGQRALTNVAVHRPTDRARLTPFKIAGIRCTNILRTLIDLGAVAPGDVHALLGHALATRSVTIGAVETMLLEQACRGRHGVVALRSAVDDWSIDAKPADSVLEIAFCRLVERHDLPAVEFHPIVEGWEVDFRFAGTRVLVECDGWGSHGLDRDQFERDRRRDADLTAAGWIVSRHTYRAITSDAARTAARLRRLLARAAAT